VGIGSHLNLTTGNLGGDLKSLEESSLSRITSSTSLGNNHINGGNGSNLGGSGTNIGFKSLTDFSEISVGENETNVSAAAGLELLDGRARVLLTIFTDALAHHGVLSHEDFSLAAESLTGLLELTGSYIVNFDDEALGVRSEVALQGLEVLFFAFSRKRHFVGSKRFGTML
jgi:hypothetical protein